MTDYVTPVTNRTARSFFNVSDWTRIYNNSQILAAAVGTSFDTISLPTVTSIPNITDLNKLIGNIERARLANLSAGALLALRYNWQEGNVSAIRYTDVNLWEETIRIMITAFQTRHNISGVTVAGASMTWRNNNG